MHTSLCHIRGRHNIRRGVRSGLSPNDRGFKLRESRASKVQLFQFDCFSCGATLDKNHRKIIHKKTIFSTNFQILFFSRFLTVHGLSYLAERSSIVTKEVSSCICIFEHCRRKLVRLDLVWFQNMRTTSKLGNVCSSDVVSCLSVMTSHDVTVVNCLSFTRPPRQLVLLPPRLSGRPSTVSGCHGEAAL